MTSHLNSFLGLVLLLIRFVYLWVDFLFFLFFYAWNWEILKEREEEEEIIGHKMNFLTKECNCDWVLYYYIKVEGAAFQDGRTPSIWDTFTHAGQFLLFFFFCFSFTVIIYFLYPGFLCYHHQWWIIDCYSITLFLEMILLYGNYYYPSCFAFSIKKVSIYYNRSFRLRDLFLKFFL